jgi:hypothetical protein
MKINYSNIFNWVLGGTLLASLLLTASFTFAAHDKPLTKPPVGGSCESGFSLSAGGTCELIVTHQTDGECPAKYDEVPGETSGGCILLRHAASLCKQDGSEIYDSDQNKCVANASPTSCPEGESYDEELEECVPETGGPGGSGGTSGGTFEIPNPLESDDFVTLLNNIITALIKLATPVAVIMIVWAGFLLTTSGGNEDKVRTARRTILYTVIGFVILLFSKGIASLIEDIVHGGGGT